MHKHHSEGRHHLTQQLQHEIQEVRKLEKELLALEQHRHLEVHHVAEVEERLLHHENLLMEALVTIIHEHAKEREGHQRGDEE